MNEDQLAQRKRMKLTGAGCIAALVLFLIGLSAAGVEPSRGTSIVCLFLLMGAASCFGSAAKIKRDATRNAES